MYDLPSKTNVKECIISEDVVERKQEPDPGLRERSRSGPRRCCSGSKDKGARGVHAPTPCCPLREVVVFPHTPDVPSSWAARSRVCGRRRRGQQCGAPSRSCWSRRSGRPRTSTRARKTSTTFGTIATIEQVHQPARRQHEDHGRGANGAAKVTQWVTKDRSTSWWRSRSSVAERLTSDVELQALVRTVKSTFERYVKLNRAVPPEMLLGVNALEDARSPRGHARRAAAKFKLAERQELLETVDVGERLERIYKALLNEIEFLQVEKKLKSRVQARAGEQPARVLAQRADEGHPKGARRQGGPQTISRSSRRRWRRKELPDRARAGAG